MSISRWWCRAVPGTREAGGCDVACDVAWSLPGSAGQAFHAGQPVSRRTTMSISRWWCRAVPGTREAGGCDVACDVAWSLPGSAGQAFHAGQPVSRRTTRSISRWWCRAVPGTREAGGPGSSEDDPPGPATTPETVVTDGV